VRPACLADLPSLLLLEEVCFSCDRMSRRSFVHLMRRGHAGIWVSETQGRINGSIVLLYRAGASVARLYSIAVHPDKQGCGIGRALLGTGEQAVRALGLPYIGLEVAVSNRSALALYRRSGYIIWSRLPAYYEGGEAALRLRKHLEPACCTTDDGGGMSA